MIGIVIVNFNTCDLSLACVASLARHGRDGEPVVMVDNGSEPAQVERLRAGIASVDGAEMLPLPQNRGFAGGCNAGIAVLLARADISHVLLINSDAELCNHALTALRSHLAGNADTHMLGTRVHGFDDAARVDSLGITLYASALTSNRKHLTAPWIGPTGGFALYSRVLLETLIKQHGEIFDQRFFCYAEDTDLALRALLLGFAPTFMDRCTVLHHGQASSGGGFSDFVLYHGIRNSIWTMWKDLPWPMLVAMSPLIVVLHVGIVVRHCLRGRAGVVWRLYRDAFRGFPAMWRARHVIQSTRRISSRRLWQHVNPRFYDRDYIRGVLRDLWPWPRKS